MNSIYQEITGVAIKHSDGRIFQLPRPFRHHHVIKVMAQVCELPTPITGEQGFVTEEGLFIDRRLAADLALIAEIVEELIDPPNLCSEDLW